MSKIPGYELHKLQVNASDAAGTPVHLAYYDTGIPASPGAEAATTAYRTLVIMHGLNYSSREPEIRLSAGMKSTL